jgi:hypothetical protein
VQPPIALRRSRIRCDGAPSDRLSDGRQLDPTGGSPCTQVVWALDFQFDSTVDGKAIRIASMIDGHTRLSLMNIVERSITARRLTELDKAFALWGGPPLVLRRDKRSGVHFSCAAAVLWCLFHGVPADAVRVRCPMHPHPPTRDGCGID